MQIPDGFDLREEVRREVRLALFQAAIGMRPRPVAKVEQGSESPQPKPRRWVFVETGEVRQAMPGEFSPSPDGAMLRWHHITDGEHRIVRLVESPE